MSDYYYIDHLITCLLFCGHRNDFFLTPLGPLYHLKATRTRQFEVTFTCAHSNDHTRSCIWFSKREIAKLNVIFWENMKVVGNAPQWNEFSWIIIISWLCSGCYNHHINMFQNKCIMYRVVLVKWLNWQRALHMHLRIWHNAVRTDDDENPWVNNVDH